MPEEMSSSLKDGLLAGTPDHGSFGHAAFGHGTGDHGSFGHAAFGHGTGSFLDSKDCCGHGDCREHSPWQGDGHGHDHGTAAHGDAHGHGHGWLRPSNGNGHGNGHGHSHGKDSGGHDDGFTMWKNSVNPVDWLRAHDPAECGSPCRNPYAEPLADCEQARCDHSELNFSTNVIVMVRANELIVMSQVNSLLAIISVLYISVNMICTVLNSYDNDCNPSEPHCSPATTPYIFHNLEFWATFVFNAVDVFALSYSPKCLSNQYTSPTLLKLVVLFNVGLSFLASMLVAIDLEKFEIPAHELEYLNEITIWLFDAVILLSLVRGRSHQASNARADKKTIIGLGVIGVVCISQFVIYNGCGWTADGDSNGEQAAHYLEFAFGIASAVITFWFTMDNKLSADQRLRQIMYRDS